MYDNPDPITTFAVIIWFLAGIAGTLEAIREDKNSK